MTTQPPRRTSTRPARPRRPAPGSARRSPAPGIPRRHPATPSWTSTVSAGLRDFYQGLALILGRRVRTLGTARPNPAHRCDNLGLLAVVVTLLLVLAWTPLDWPIFEPVRVIALTLVGSLNAVAWIAAGLLGWQLLRGPESRAALGWLLGGWLAITAGAAGIVHLAHGAPDVDHIAAAGGLAGFIVVTPMASLPAPVIALALIALVSGGVLAAARTSPRQVPHRLGLLRTRLTRRTSSAPVPSAAPA